MVTCCRSAAPGRRRRCNRCASARGSSWTRTTRSIDGSEAEWEKADAIVGGAGLLLRDGRIITDWKVEQLAPAFAETRHPRTLVGTHPDGSVWLVTVDGRQPKLSAGMSLAELRALAQRLGLRNALNLDGGGSTTMWVAGQDREQPVGRRGAEESQRRADRHASVSRRATCNVLRCYVLARPTCDVLCDVRRAVRRARAVTARDRSDAGVPSHVAARRT